MVANLKIVPIEPPEGLSNEEFRASLGLVQLPVKSEFQGKLPIEFDAAVKAIAACRTIDEARYWDNRADALAAWAKIYADDIISREARSLKLHAYRRIGKIAEKLRPKEFRGRQGAIGPRSLLIENGFSSAKARFITRIALMAEPDFQAAANSPKPPSPTVLVEQRLRPNPVWAEFSSRMRVSITALRKSTAQEIVTALTEKDFRPAQSICDEILGWMVDFNEALLKRLDQLRHEK